MYLKRIEVHGFKSFANKLIFEFHNGVTCIVGPNGSGKSNVADAVRWVLGEQSAKQLRGSSMQDVIFSGTESRKPQSSAYVAITIDNTDHALNISYDEVTVARRVYRSGESEYLINGNICRLRQVQELFYDTGIGKEGYSIIGQGQIDKILSSRPEDRRELFDEAAGIVKYKRRKLEAVRKLDAEHQNLERVTDILNELEKQVGPLKNQAETAKIYLKLRDELKGLEISLFVLDYGSAGRQLKELEERLKIVTDELSDTRSSSEQLKQKYESLEDYLERLDAVTEAARKRAEDASILIEQLNGQMELSRNQIQSGSQEEDRIQTRLSEIEREASEKQTQKNEKLSDLETLKNNLKDAGIIIQNQSAELNSADEVIRRQTEEQSGSNETLLAGLQEKTGLTEKIGRLQARLEQYAKRKDAIEELLKSLDSDEEENRRAFDELEKELSMLSDRKKELDSLIESLSADTGKKQKKIAEISQELQRVTGQYHEASTRVRSLKSIAERYEGYGNTVRRVMERKKEVAGIRGSVADLIHTEKKYETAIETALGGSIQNIVTDTEQTAKKLVRWLKENRLGRATFLPLDGLTVNGNGVPDAAKEEPGVLGLCSDLVETEREYDILRRFLLGRVLCVTDLDRAVQLQGKYRHSLRIVTLDGELLNPGGSISGGAFKNSGNLLGRRREMDELEKQAENAEVRISELTKLLEDARRELEALQQSQAETEKELRENRLDWNTKSYQRDEMMKNRNRLGGNRKDLEEERGSLTLAISADEREKQEASTALVKLDTNQDDARKTVEALTLALEDARNNREAIAEKLRAAQLLEASLHQQIDFKTEDINRISEESERLQKEKSQLFEELAHSKEGAQNAQLALEELKKQIVIAEADRDRAAQEASDGRTEREKTASEQRSYFAERDDLARKETDLNRELVRLQNQQEKQAGYLEDRTDYLWTEYELSPSEALEIGKDSGLSQSALKSSVSEHKRQIKALGPVNVNAIEECKDVLERYTFLKEQHEDLVQAENTLLDLIEELETGMKQQFREQFGKINEEFGRVFEELFGGGKGILELTEQDDVTEAGIRIIAQPPGKKLQNMMQLSGGEKALTAIALLFAIQNLKPSPFCLLDEIEAALDDSNVDRFAGYLHKLTEHTQFILISHRRGTMLAADRLYGITMQEKGVSTMVSVNLIEDKLDA